MAGLNNQLSRYGAISRVLPYLGPQGQIFIVAGSSQTFLADLMSSFPSDKGGVSRVFTTLSAASSMTVSGRGDVILVCPGYTETVIAAGGIQLSSASVTIVGLGNGSTRPTISFTTATTADMNVDAAGITIDNLIFDLTGIDALAGPIDVNAAGFTMKNCLVITANATNQAVLALTADTASTDDMTLLDCQFLGTADAGMTAAVEVSSGGNRYRIERCTFIGAYTSGVGAIQQLTNTSLDFVVKDCIIVNLTASSTKAAVFTASTTGMLTNNRIGIGSGAAPFTMAAGWWAGNYNAAAVATNGTLV